jgi:hypothetical protein
VPIAQLAPCFKNKLHLSPRCISLDSVNTKVVSVNIRVMRKRRRKETFSDRFWLDKDGNLSILQKPNTPILIWVASVAIQILLGVGNPISEVSKVIGSISLVIWAILEVYSGVSYFRKLLGAFVLILMAFVYL